MVGTAATVSGVVTSKARGKSVTLQRHQGSTWKTIATGRLSASSTYRFVVRPKTKSTWTLRVVKAGTARLKQGVSPTRTLHAVGHVYVVNAALLPGSVSAGATATMSGRVSPSAAHGKVMVEQLIGRLWKPVATVTLSASSAYTSRFVVSAVGSHSYRARKPLTATVAAGVSAVRVLTVTAPAADATIPPPVVPPPVTPPPVTPPSGKTQRISLSSGGVEGDSLSASPSTSADGRFVAFASSASNLVAGDTNGALDAFVRDRVTGTTARVSVASDGTQSVGEHDGLYPSISADGRYVTFVSTASNLVAGDTNGTEDVFVHDQLVGSTTRVSVAGDGTESNSTVFILGTRPAISADGRYVTFDSFATNLVPGDTNGEEDVFVHDQLTGATTRVNVSTDGTQGIGSESNMFASISGDGRLVAFESDATNLVANDTNAAMDIFVHDLLTGVTTRVNVASDGAQADDTITELSPPSMSTDGRYVAFGSRASNLISGDTNGTEDVFVHDRTTGVTSRVSIASDGTEGNSVFDNNGGNDGAGSPSISGDGRYVAFMSTASNLVPGDANGALDAFVHDRVTGATSRVDVASDGTEGSAGTEAGIGPSISADGLYVAFESAASNLVTGDNNNAMDVFVRSLQ